MPIDDKRKIIFIHIPKTGGTSLSSMLFDNIRPSKDKLLGSMVEVGGKYRRSSHCTAQEILLLKPKKFLEYPKVTCVRNPYHRTVSEYFHLKRFDKSHPVLGNINKISFKEFVVSMVDNYGTIRETCQNYKYEDYFIHFLPQVDFLKIDGRMIDVKIFKFEKYHEIEEYFQKKTHLNENKIKKEYESLYDNESRKIISNLYKEDFETFGYRI